MQLYNYIRSSAAIRVRIGLNYKGLDYTKIDISLLNNDQKSDTYTKVNPSGLVPTLDDNGSIIHQSLAILEYLDEQYTSKPILPNDSLSRAYVREIALAVACDIHPLNNLRILNYLTNNLHISDEEKNTWYKHWIEQGLTGLEKIISTNKNYTGKYCYKDMFSIADICLIPQLINARRFNCNLDNYPTLIAIDHECMKLDAVKKALPENQ